MQNDTARVASGECVIAFDGARVGKARNGAGDTRATTTTIRGVNQIQFHAKNGAKRRRRRRRN